MSTQTRDGSLLLERMAKRKVVEEVSSFSASELVQILMAPETLAQWASGEGGVNTSLLYNVLSGSKSSRPVLQRLATRLGVKVPALTKLIERPKVPFHYRVPPDVTRVNADGSFDPSQFEDRPPDDPKAPRDGTLLLEKMVRRKVSEEISSFTASQVIQFLLAPETLREWAAFAKVGNTSLLYSVLSASQPSRPLVEKLAIRLRVHPGAVEELINRPPAPFIYQLPQPPGPSERDQRAVVQGSIFPAAY